MGTSGLFSGGHHVLPPEDTNTHTAAANDHNACQRGCGNEEAKARGSPRTER